MAYNNWKVIHCIDKHESTNTEIKVQIRHNIISKIPLNNDEDISDNNYGAITTIYINVENGYDLVT